MSRSLTAVAHAGYTVERLQETVDFLVHCCGFTLESIGPPANPGLLGRIVSVEGANASIAYLRLGDSTLELLEYTSPVERQDVRLRPCDRGFAHIALHVDDVPGHVARAAQYGFKAVGEVVAIPAGPRAGKRVVYLANRADFTVELLER
jgi:hypothetical protein